LTGTVLVFSWIDQSASSELHPCVGEDSTQYAAKEMSTALGIRLKPNQNLQKIQLTLFDSPEDAPFDCADNQLYKILPKFKPDRNYHFVDNYISYYDSCLSNKHTSLDKIVDVVLLPLKHGCTNSIWHPIVCRTCAHEYSVNWYTTATGDQAEQYGLWWSPLMNSSADTLDQYYLQSATSELTLDTKQKCPDDQVEKCDIAEPEPDL